MIFKQCQQVLDGTKTQTRRLVKEGEQLADAAWGYDSPTVLKWYRIKWAVGRTYAVQPGRGKKAVGRIRITGIRREWLIDILPGDTLAEGIMPICNEYGPRWYQASGIEGEFITSREAFRALWNGIHKKRGARWADNPEVWVLEFEAL